MTQDSNPQAELDSVGDPATQHWRNIPRRTLTIALSVLPIVALINVGVLVWSLGGIDLSERIIRPGLLALAACLVFVPMISNSLRLAIWARFLGLELGFVKAMKIVTGTMVANSVTPSATGSVPIKLLFMMGEGIKPRRALTLISFQTAEDALVLFSLVGICAGISGFALFDFLSSDPDMAASFFDGVQTAGMVAMATIGGLIALCLLLVGGVFGQRVRDFALRMVQRARESVAQIVMDWAAVAKKGKAIALLNVTLASGQWMVRFSIAGLVLAAFGVEWQPALFWLMQYLVQSISSIVPTPGGAGGAEAGFLLLFSPFVDREILFPAMSTWRLMFFYLPLTGAALIFFLLARRARRQAKQEQRATPPPPIDDAAIQPAE